MRLIILPYFICLTSLLFAQPKIDNPVLPGVADAGVMKFNGRYYIGGVFTNGDFYVSKDLVNWEGPVHVFSMNNEWATRFGIGDDQIHANDMHYINGTFHLYWSVNHWSRERNVVHIAHAVADNPLGPYDEPVKDTWLDNRIDAHLFVDDDGKLYFYMVKFTDGNTIWVRPMKDPNTFEGEARYIFASQPGNWETLDNRVEEGPWVIQYRNRYYLMYNTNHTSTRWGNYALGVAEASGPLDFNHGNKYSHPVVKSNQIDPEDMVVDLLKYQDNGEFYYSTDTPASDWYQPSFDASSWSKGKPGFGFPVIENSSVRKVCTTWDEGTCRLRKTFVYNKKRNGNLSMRINHEGSVRVYLNGRLLYDREGGDYIQVNLNEKMSLVKEGDNVLAVEGQPAHQSCFLDIALFDMKDRPADDILFTPGQPNILRGPNGFEWWLIYMANKNAEPRGQYINRVHFFDKKLTVDGITAKNTPGYHPQPAKPTYQYLSDNNQPAPVRNQVITSIPSTHYLFEAGLKLTGKTDTGGIIAWKSDENNWLKILIDGRNNHWTYTLQQNGASQTGSFPLPADFRPEVFHTLTVFKNHTDFMVRIDNLPAPVNPLIQTGFSGKGLPGICADNPAVQFDGITYTMGWDEFDDYITGWESTGNTEKLSLKGDLLDSYEMSLQIDAGMEKGTAGVYPVFIDPDQFVKATFDFSKQQLTISGQIKRKTITPQNISLSGLKDCYINMVYSDFMERHFRFETPTTLDAILFKKDAIYHSDTMIENIHEQFHIYYIKDGRWQPIDKFTKADWEHPGLSRIEFAPVETTELIFTNKVPENENFVMRDFSLQKIWIHEIFKQSYNLRVVKNKENLYFFVDGKEVCRLPAVLQPSRIGLFSGDTKIRLNGITVFHLPD